MTSIGVIGLGPMGRAIIHYLINNTNYTVNGYDINDEVITIAKKQGINAIKADAANTNDLRRVASENDLIISAVPQSLADKVVLELHRQGVPVVDLIFMWRYSEELARELTSGSIIIPACGWAPGLTNMLAFAAAMELEEVKEVGIHVGGNPIDPKPPLYYELLFSLDSTVDEYVRPATIIKDGKPTNIDPLSEVFVFNTWLVNGNFAEFYTDGLSTLLITLPKHFKTLQNAYERTIRWSKHLETMLKLKELGLLNDTETAKYILSKTLKPGLNDFSITVIEARGKIGGEPAIVRFEGIDYAQGGFTSMARLTGFTAAIVAELVIKGEIKGEGLIPLEEAYMNNKNILNEVLRRLRKQNIKFWKSKTTIMGEQD